MEGNTGLHEPLLPPIRPVSPFRAVDKRSGLSQSDTGAGPFETQTTVLSVRRQGGAGLSDGMLPCRVAVPGAFREAWWFDCFAKCQTAIAVPADGVEYEFVVIGLAAGSE